MLAGGTCARLSVVISARNNCMLLVDGRQMAPQRKQIFAQTDTSLCLACEGRQAAGDFSHLPECSTRAAGARTQPKGMRLPARGQWGIVWC
jgi:hypothetical protein